MVSFACERHDHLDYIIGKMEGGTGWAVGRKESGYFVDGTFAEAVDHCVEIISDECESATEVDEFFAEPPLTLKKRLDALAEYLDAFESPIEFGYMDFVRTCYESGWIQPFDWADWMGTPEAIELRDDPSVLERATPEQLGKLLTVIIRQDRFVEGALGSAFDSGLLTGIVRRASVLATEQESPLP